jgi:hypothetical protein
LNSKRFEGLLVRKAVPLVILVISLSAILAPMFIENALAMGCQPPGCQLQVITNVPLSEHVVHVLVDGSTTYTMNNTFTFANGTTHTIQVLDTSFIGASGKRYTFKQWTYVGDGSTWDPTPTMNTPLMYTNFTTATCQGTLNCPFLAQFTVSPPLGCKTNCSLDALTNVPAAEGTVMVQDKLGNSYSLSPTAPQTFSWANGTTQTLQVTDPTITGTSGARYVFKQWSCAFSSLACSSVSGANSSTTLTIPAIYYNYTDPARNPPLNGQGGFTAQFDKQYQLTLTFTDQNNHALSPPSSLQIASGTTVINLTSYSGIWEDALVWKVQNVVWEGVPGIQVQGQTINLTNGASSPAVVKLQAFSASVKAVDSSNNPVQGVTVTVYFTNSTSRAFQTNSQGLVQLGYVPLNYTAVITYNGNTICNCVVNTSNPQNNPYVVQVSVASGGSGTTPLVSAFVLLTIFGIAAFLVLLAIKVRKAPPPPRIE